MIWPPNITGVIHAGAHLAEEFTAYEEHGVTHTLWIEPQWKCAAEIRRRYGDLPGVEIWPVALGRERGTRRLNQASNGQSTSLLPPKEHRRAHPSITFSPGEWCVLETLDSYRTPPGRYQLLVLDCQGFELEALKGAEWALAGLSWVCSEVARVELYAGQPLVGELRAWMSERGWELVSEEWWPGSDEGECVWRSKERT